MRIRFLYRLLTATVITALLLSGAGCQKAAVPQNEPPGAAVVFTDALGHSVTITKHDRVIAATGSFAELWLLAGGSLVGATQDALEANPSLNGVAEDIGGLHGPNMETILALEPDFMILSAEVEGQAQLYDSLHAAGINAVYFATPVFSDYLATLKICTDITGRADLYQQNGLAVESQIQAALETSQGQPAPKVLLVRASSGQVEARNSTVMAGVMLKELGGRNIADSDTSLLEALSMEVIIQENPDFIFVVTMGSSEEKALHTIQETLESNPAWASLAAVKNGRYTLLPKELFHLKPNNRWGESYAMLAEILYGE
jgi:iron complex transport system substrate-binding protein